VYCRPPLSPKMRIGKVTVRWPPLIIGELSDVHGIVRISVGQRGLSTSSHTRPGNEPAEEKAYVVDAGRRRV